MLYMHGGGLVMGTVDYADAQCTEIAREVGCVVASVDYRLAPENPYPVPLEDCYSALMWLHSQCAGLELNAERIAAGGTSAGGGLAAALALLARDRGQLAVAFQFLEAPMLDHRTGREPDDGCLDAGVWPVEANTFGWKAYLGNDEAPPGPYASPALESNLTDLPPAYICVSSNDLFLEEATDYGLRLLDGGVPVELHVYPGGFHGSARAVPDHPLSRRWRMDSIAALHASLNEPNSHLTDNGDLS